MSSTSHRPLPHLGSTPDLRCAAMASQSPDDCSISAPQQAHSGISLLAQSACLARIGASPPRPALRVITSFPPPPARRPMMHPHSRPLAAATILRQPVPVRHCALEPLLTAPLLTTRTSVPLAPSAEFRRKLIPALQVHVDLEHDRTSVCPPSRPEPPIRSSLEKRRNRGAVVISTAMYTSYHPGQDWGNMRTTAKGEGAAGVLEKKEVSPIGVIPKSSRPTGRGHKRTLSDKFKSLFSSRLQPAHLEVGASSATSGVAETYERVQIYDDADIPTYSATYPQPDDPFHLAPPLSTVIAPGQPGRPYRSPGTANFIVSREAHIWTGEEGVAEEGDQTGTEGRLRRNTFGITITDEAVAGIACGDPDGGGVIEAVGSPLSSGWGRMGSPSGGSEADDEMSASTDGDGEAEIVDAYFGGRVVDISA